MFFGIVEVAALLAGGTFLYRDYRNGFLKTKVLLGWADRQFGLIIGAINTPEKRIDRLLGSLNQNKLQLEEKIADVQARADQFGNSTNEATALSDRAKFLAKEALNAQSKAVREGRQKDALKNEQIYKALIAQMISNEGLAVQYRKVEADAREAAARLENELDKVKIQLSLAEVQAARAKADLSIAGAYNLINQFLVDSSSGSDGKEGLRRLSNEAFFERSKGKHLLELRRDNFNGNGQAGIVIAPGQVMFPPEVEGAAEEFRNECLLLPAPQVTDEAAN